MIYRPASLKNIPQQPDSLEWSVDSKGGIKVKNLAGMLFNCIV